MARKREAEDSKNNVDNKMKRLDSSAYSNFTKWLENEGFHVNKKACITNKDVSSGWGMIATEDIAPDEIIFTIPRKSILCPQNSKLGKLIEESKEELKSRSGWVELLVVLLHEFTQVSSRWQPYFDIVSFQHLHLPMFWSKEELSTELTGTPLPASISSDLANLTNEFNNIVLPFVNKHPSLFKTEAVTMDLFKQMVSFVMAYSFTEPEKEDDNEEEDEDDEDDNVSNPPIMVPLADILNHVSKSNAQLKFAKDHLEMRATKPIRAGEEVYNTYGHLSNQALLHMYGYTQKPQLAEHDTVEISMELLERVVKEDASRHEDRQLLDHKVKHLKELGMMGEEAYVVLGRSAVFNAPLLHTVLKVLALDEGAFKSYLENESWMSEDEEDEDDVFEYSRIHKLPSKRKVILKRLVERHLSRFGKKLCEEEEEEARLLCNFCTTSREACIKLYSCYLRIGQMRICHLFLDSLSKE